MAITLELRGQSADRVSEGFTVTNDEGERISWASLTTVPSRFRGALVPTLLIGGVGTDVRYRRQGHVREMFNEVWKLQEERKWAVSMLHPFSSSYYRQFGYDRIADHKTAEFPMSAIAHIPRCRDFKPMTAERVKDAAAVYEEFASTRSILFPRRNGEHFDPNGKVPTYLHYDENGRPDAYVTCWVENYYDVNRMQSVNLNVNELAFTTAAALRAIFGFIRMYEGQNHSVKIHNYAMAPEVDSMIGETMGVPFCLISDIAARVMDMRQLLEAAPYPKHSGRFSVMVDDCLPSVRGLWEVEYADGKCLVTRKEDGKYDLRAPAAAMTQLLYGYDGYDAMTASCMDGVTVCTDCADFFSVFGKGRNGLFEHF